MGIESAMQKPPSTAIERRLDLKKKPPVKSVPKRAIAATRKTVAALRKFKMHH
jgi:hypothetical protein